MHYNTGAAFDNWLDAVDGSFCTFEGGDNPDFVRNYVVFMSFNYLVHILRTVFIPTPFQVALMVCFVSCKMKKYRLIK